MASYLQQSQRYVNYKESNEFWYTMVIPEMEYANKGIVKEAAKDIINNTIETIKQAYITLINIGIRPEDARCLLPQCSPTTIKIGMNLREFLFNFYPLRSSKHAQDEIRLLANSMLDALKLRYVDDNAFNKFLAIYKEWQPNNPRPEWRWLNERNKFKNWLHRRIL